ncbi:DNA-directed RNA polymerase, mitochondrial isoform 2-T2 [Thomomys bottae]
MVGGPRRSSSASPRQLDRRKDWCLAELLEVLEARVQQLQAESLSSVSVQDVLSRWEQKLNRDKQNIQKRQPHIEILRKKLSEKEGQKLKLQPLRLEPEFKNKKLASCLQGKLQSPWEEKLKKVLQSIPQKLSTHEQATLTKEKEESVSNWQQNLLAFLQCCVYSDQVPLAHHVLVNQYSMSRKRELITLAMYNVVMQGWAREGSFKGLVYVFFMVKDSGLTPDLQSYAAALQCMGKIDQDTRTIKRCLKQMTKEGLQLKQLFTDLVLFTEERNMLLRAVLKAQPNFILPKPPRQVNTTTLLKDVYAQDGPVTYPKLPLPLKTLQDLFQQQLRMELETTVSVKSVEKISCLDERAEHARKILKTLRAQWEAALYRTLQETKARTAQEAHLGQPSLYPFLCLLSEKDLVGILMKTLQVLPSQGESLIFLSQDLGTRIFNRFAIQQKQRSKELQHLEQRYLQYLHLLASDTQVAKPCLPRQYWEALGEWDVPAPQPWPVPLLIRLGKQLAEMLVLAVEMPHNLTSRQGSSKLIPVLYHVYSFRSYRQVGILKPHPAYTQLLATAIETTLNFDSNSMPMLCPPLPWTSSTTGAFLLSPTKLMRGVDGNHQHQRLLDRCQPFELHGALDALTQLGNCAWRVNGRLLDLVLEVFLAKGSTRLGVPPPASEAPQPSLNVPPLHMTPNRRAEMRRELMRCLKVAREMHSLRMEALYRLSLAQHLRDRIFWLPHNMDFRGRTYPCPPHFNHLGSDLARSLLQFAEGRPLGPQGLDWLKIHLVNLTGAKKRESLKARLAFADQVMEDILDSADQPMTGRKWWMEADEPWQTLACCIEVAQAVRSPDPAAYVSHQPVHQDGSCNGLQHYAALGRDSMGAASVNLLPSELPQDVYSEVAQQVEVFRKQDMENGVQVAKVLDGFISRKVVKQTVMTVVYGVTRYGGRLQIEKRLRELNSFPQEFIWEASFYLVRLVFRSLQEMFSGTRAIQRWLSESARLISQAGHAVEWVTPMGIPVIQPYHQDTKLQVPPVPRKPNTLKQKNGFPPNFIHSLDSTHMMLTALHCYRKGLNFVSVHDCFWTHAADISVMNQVCREQFIHLHSQPILENLSSFLLQRFCSHPKSQNASENPVQSQLRQRLMAVPPIGDFDLNQVKHSKYFFS